MATISQALEAVPMFSRQLVQAGVEARGLASVNKAFRRDIHATARGAVADLLEISPHRLPSHAQLRGDYAQVLDALQLGQRARLKPDVYATLRDLCIKAGTSPQVLLRHLHRNERCEPTCFWFTERPQRWGQMVAHYRALEQRAWTATGRTRPQADDWLSKKVLRVAESGQRASGYLSLFPGTWAGLHVGLAAAGALASRVPLPSPAVALVAVAAGLVASAVLLLPDLVGTTIFLMRHGNAERFCRLSTSEAILSRVWAGRPNPYQQLLNWPNDQARREFALDKLVMLNMSAHKWGHGQTASPRELTKRTLTTPFGNQLVTLQYAPIEPRLLEEAWVLRQYEDYNGTVRPYLISDRCIAWLGRSALETGYWSDVVAAIVVRHRRRDEFRLPL